VFATQERSRLDGSVTGLLPIPFEDDERRGLVAVATVTRPGRVGALVRPGAWRFGLVGAVTRVPDIPLSLAVLPVPCLLLAPLFRVSHT
jgi:hypothetical protein